MAWNIYPVEESGGILIAARHELAGEEVVGAVNERITALNHAGWTDGPLLPEWGQGHPIGMFDCFAAIWYLRQFFLHPPVEGAPAFAPYDIFAFAPTLSGFHYYPLQLTTAEAFNNLYEGVRHMRWVTAGLSSLPHVEAGGWEHSAVQRGPRAWPGKYIGALEDNRGGAISTYKTKVGEEDRVLSTSAGPACALQGYFHSAWSLAQEKMRYGCANSWSGLPYFDPAYKVGFGTINTGDFDVGITGAMVHVIITNVAGYNGVSIGGTGTIYWGDTLPNPITVGTMYWSGIGPLVTFPLDEWSQRVLVTTASIAGNSRYYVKSYAPWSTWTVPGGAVWPRTDLGEQRAPAKVVFGPNAVALELDFEYV